MDQGVREGMECSIRFKGFRLFHRFLFCGRITHGNGWFGWGSLGAGAVRVCLLARCGPCPRQGLCPFVSGG